ADPDGRIQRGVHAVRTEEGIGQIAGARVFQDVLDADGATALQGFDVPGERRNLPCARVFVAVGVAAVRGDGFQPFAVQLPASGASAECSPVGGDSATR